MTTAEPAGKRCKLCEQWHDAALGDESDNPHWIHAHIRPTRWLWRAEVIDVSPLIHGPVRHAVTEAAAERWAKRRIAKARAQRVADTKRRTVQ